MTNLTKFSLLAMVLTSTACASVIKGTNQALTFNSDPEGAEILLDDKPVGVTPLVIKYRKNSIDRIVVRRDGYQEQAFSMDTKFDGIALLSFFWDLGTTDLVTGAAFEYVPSSYYFKLKKVAKVSEKCTDGKPCDQTSPNAIPSPPAFPSN